MAGMAGGGTWLNAITETTATRGMVTTTSAVWRSHPTVAEVEIPEDARELVDPVREEEPAPEDGTRLLLEDPVVSDEPHPPGAR